MDAKIGFCVSLYRFQSAPDCLSAIGVNGSR